MFFYIFLYKTILSSYIFARTYYCHRIYFWPFLFSSQVNAKLLQNCISMPLVQAICVYTIYCHVCVIKTLKLWYECCWKFAKHRMRKFQRPFCVLFSTTFQRFVFSFWSPCASFFYSPENFCKITDMSKVAFHIANRTAYLPSCRFISIFCSRDYFSLPIWFLKTI